MQVFGSLQTVMSRQRPFEDLVVCNVMCRALVGLQFFPGQLSSNTTGSLFHGYALSHRFTVSDCSQ